MTGDGIERVGWRESLEQAADRLTERVRTVHQRVACPMCLAPVGQPCRRALRAYRSAGIYATGQPVLKHPHDERLRADGIPKR